MNYSTAIFLINDKVRAISAIYEAETLTSKPAPRTVFKTFDTSIKKDDLILVPSGTRHNVTVCKVVEVDLEMDLETHINIDWVIGVVDKSDYTNLLAMEQVAIDTIKSAEKNRKREELRKSLMADSESKLLALPISSMNQPTIEG
ncbi:MAG: hypothetical protein ACXV2C_03660 [Candidatus Bathyarchaeia archaeon]